MKNTPQTTPTQTSPARSPKEAFRAFVRQCQEQLPYPVVWESNQWTTSDSDAEKRGHLDNRYSLLFTDHASSRVSLEKRIPFEPAFGDLVKACVVYRRVNRGVQTGVQRVFVRATRYVYNACTLPVRRDPTLLSRQHFVEAEALVLKREKGESAYRVGQMIEAFAKILERQGVTRAPLDFRCSIARPLNVEDRTGATFAERSGRLPSPKILDALADIGNDAKLSDWWFDLLRMRLIDILLVCGFRVGELLTLPQNTLVREIALDENGGPKRDAITGEIVERVGLRYWPEKGAEPIVKWVPTVANALVIRAIGDIDRICKPARDNAKWLEGHPGKVQVNIDPDQQLTLLRVARVIGIAEDYGNVRQWVRHGERGGNALIRHEGRRAYVLGADLARAIASDRYDKPVVAKRSGVQQSLGSSLIVVFKHAGSVRKPINAYISEPMIWGNLSDFICGRPSINMRSIFERFGYLDDSGKPLRIKSHDFRRVLNTMAQKGGLSQVEIARWMGRRRIADNAAYDYRTAADMAAELRPLFERNEMFGEIAKQVRQLPDSERMKFLESRLAMVHTTPYGNCASTIAENPCATAVSCLGGCRHFLRAKGDTKSRERLLKLEQQTLMELQKAREAANAGKLNAENWIRAQETVLSTVRAALAIDDDSSIPTGEAVAVKPDGPMLGESL
ncbi:MAG: hypothetical protein ACXWNK_13530 [Vulcanimicrobiaceae bacterium]